MALGQYIAGMGFSNVCGLGEELDILFLQDAVQICGDAHVCAQLLDGGDGGNQCSKKKLEAKGTL